MAEQELREKIVEIDVRLGKLGLNFETHAFVIGFDYADQILALIKEAGYVKLAEDQGLPALNLPTLSGNRSLEITMTSFAKSIRGNMLKAGWRKVEL